jgi:hypothetical protein
MLKWLKGMSIKGGTPPQLYHPLQDANEAKRVSDSLSAKEPVKALAEASQWLTSIRDAARLARHHRIELIALLDAATRKAQARMADLYVTLLESDHREEKLIWQTASDFSVLLVEGYLQCAGSPGESVEVSQEVQPLLPLLAARGMRALRLQMKWVSMRYGELRPEIWGEFARLLTLAESVNSVAAPVDYPIAEMQASPSDEFVRAMMFWSALPGALSPVEQDIAERLIVYLTQDFHFGVQRAEGSDYFFNLNGAHPPLRFVSSAPVSASTRYLEVSEARQAVQAMHSLVRGTGSMPAGVDCGPAGEINVTVRVLKHLSVNWAKELPARATGRRKAGAALAIKSAHSYQHVLAVVRHGGLDVPSTSGGKVTQSWIAEDISAGGCGVIVSEGGSERLHVGVLVALQLASEGQYHVGVIRRVSGRGERQRHIGIQLISHSAVPVYLRSLLGAKQGRNRESAILLSAKPSSNGSVYILARRDLFSGREPVEAAFGVPEVTVVLEPAGVVESGKDFDWLRYKVPESAV